ncbi:AAA family ATPase [Herbiconiux sp. KACC 21604]|uniref:AAA family ATPase n=1 Tax=unclassified Herbiconiux TaxID=2618217 RepID=UPI00149232CA|nr:AAA family ATPase [Herbiconiux sp. SALV-R1]QJU54015.1 AAA family ATPase [Herbiconiux sp. SALV-R1]WPO85047.1 AAA family ATPase [Herbiconiux sp. KACC 21604]
MYLKSLTLKGFKSFANPTTFAFETGVTCVVGPNGSGKSNVVDALAWVMGEQGAKTLRGGKMEDVIFAGTSTKGPLGRAEVTLTIDNTDGALPIDYSEVTISRTLFRNGGSEYAINGEGCRLLDVQELLSDSGLGREMHVIVGQGQLDAVLHATPEGRRGFIEEAAGILKHRRRKEKTVRKLDAMQGNLTRLSDLAGEIRRQLKPLGRQAEVAKQAQSIAAIVRDAKARLLADEVVGLRAALDAAARSENERHTERMVLQERLEQNQLRIGRLEQAQVGDAVDLARRTAFGLESVQERLRNLFNLASQRLALLGGEEGMPEASPSVSPGMVADSRDEAERLQGEVAASHERWEAAQQATVSARSALDALDEQIAYQSSLVSKHDLELSKLTGQLESANSRLAAVRGEVLRQSNALEAAEARRERAAADYAEAEEESAESELDATGLDEGYEFAQSQVFEAEAEIERLREELHTHERERDALAARTSALGMALDQKDGSAELVAARLEGIAGLVAEHMKVSPGYEAAVAAALGSLADAVLASDQGAAVAAASAAAAGDMGRVELVIAEPGAGRHSGAGAAGEDGTQIAPDLLERARGASGRDALSGVVPAVDVVTAPAGVLGVLGAVAVADDLEAARAAWAAIEDAVRGGAGAPDNAGAAVGDATPAQLASLTLVTKAGEVLTRYVLRGGSGATRSRIELVAERDSAAVLLAEEHSIIERARFELAEQRGVVQVAKEQSQKALAALREFDAKLAARSERVSRLKAQLDAAGAELERLGKSSKLAEENVAQAEQAAEKARAELDVVRARPRPILDASAREGLLAELEIAREREVEARLGVETARERVRAEQARTAALEKQLEADRAAAEAAARRAVIRRRQIAAATDVAEALPAVLDSVDRSVAAARLELSQREAERAQQNEELLALRREEATLRERLQAITENVHGLELQIYEKKLHLSGLLERAASELGLVEEVLVAEYGPDQLIPDDSAVAIIDTSQAAVRAATEQLEADRLAAESDDDDAFRAIVPEGSARASVAGDASSDVVAAAAIDGDGEGLDERSTGADVEPAEPEGHPFVRAEQQQRLAKAERKLAELGRVNPLALEEFDALEQRHRFLSEQLTDLTNTRKDLLTIIDEIDERMQSIFESAFADTQEAFTKVFPVLFPGGTGSISLTDPDNLLATGIEVSVKPAGKKIERLSLLSGGERSLAAVALLIAIFKARPSPFYIMDEVEAALDDANLGRLLTIFEDLRATSQLIVITHQKRTMEIADALYGVSMRQDGVSAVVGQRVAAERAAPDRAAPEPAAPDRAAPEPAAPDRPAPAPGPAAPDRPAPERAAS